MKKLLTYLTHKLKGIYQIDVDLEIHLTSQELMDELSDRNDEWF